MEIKLLELEALLISHNWYFGKSEDNEVYNLGIQSFALIWELMDELKNNGYFTEAENLYDTYKPKLKV